MAETSVLNILMYFSVAILVMLIVVYLYFFFVYFAYKEIKVKGAMSAFVDKWKMIYIIRWWIYGFVFYVLLVIDYYIGCDGWRLDFFNGKFIHDHPGDGALSGGFHCKEDEFVIYVIEFCRCTNLCGC
ncbi:unnamed protein product [Symbiodinium pilosum]|uniref:Uncharacterized protein n=1 Tax=Symbiodinium pilosum TaxID=2952 RepID=A0A812IS99_SYMPI|nr:unnamed protein product [Symbiodinium pilosum]